MSRLPGWLGNPGGLARSVNRAVRQRVRARWGLFPVLEAMLKLRSFPGAARLRLAEQREARRLVRELGGPVHADVVTVIPTYRRPELALRAVHSALAQGVRDHRVVVVDDGAGEVPVVDDARVILVSLRRNLGSAGVVRNVGLRITESRFVAFLDDDNWWDPDHLSTSLAAHTHGVALTYTGVRRLTPSGVVVDVLAQQFRRAALREAAFIDTSAIVARRTKGLWFSRVPRGATTIPQEDWELCWRLSRSLTVESVPDVTVNYLLNPDSYYNSAHGSFVAEASTSGVEDPETE